VIENVVGKQDYVSATEVRQCARRVQCIVGSKVFAIERAELSVLRCYAILYDIGKLLWVGLIQIEDPKGNKRECDKSVCWRELRCITHLYILIIDDFRLFSNENGFKLNTIINISELL
jgi:hypothetical protein